MENNYNWYGVVLEIYSPPPVRPAAIRRAFRTVFGLDKMLPRIKTGPDSTIVTATDERLDISLSTQLLAERLRAALWRELSGGAYRSFDLAIIDYGNAPEETYDADDVSVLEDLQHPPRPIQVVHVEDEGTGYWFDNATDAWRFAVWHGWYPYSRGHKDEILRLMTHPQEGWNLPGAAFRVPLGEHGAVLEYTLTPLDPDVTIEI
jgi:hypothetical protein